MTMDAAGAPHPHSPRTPPQQVATPGGPYTDTRAKDTVEDPGFAVAVGLLGAIFAQLGASLPSRAGMELSWALAELEDYGELAPAAAPLTPDLYGHQVDVVLAHLMRYLKVLASSSPDLATTLRYLRAHEHLHAALTTLTTHNAPADTSNPNDASDLGGAAGKGSALEPQGIDADARGAEGTGD